MGLTKKAAAATPIPIVKRLILQTPLVTRCIGKIRRGLDRGRRSVVSFSEEMVMDCPTKELFCTG